MLRVYSAVAAIAVVGTLGATGWMIWGQGAGSDQFAQCQGASISGGIGDLGGPFELMNVAGETVTDAQLVTMPTILYFGYTFCPDVCPIDVARNGEVLELLEERGILAQSAFVSVDPRRDTPEVLQEFTEIFHPRMIGLSGSEAQLRQAAQAYRAYFSVPPSPEDDTYLVNHSTFSYLVLPEHGVVEVLNRSLTAPQTADRVACFIENS